MISHSVKKQVNMVAGKTVLIGNGPAAGQAAAALLEKGLEIIIAVPQAEVMFDLPSGEHPSVPPAELLTNVTLTHCRLEAGAYDLTFSGGNQSMSRTAASIILYTDYKRDPEFSRYGLTPCSEVLSLSQLMAAGPEEISNDGSIVFLAGLYKESNPLLTREIMETALELKSGSHRKVYILTGNLKVAAEGLESLYRTTREAGVTYFKFLNNNPDIQQDRTGKTTIAFKDDISGLNFRLSPDLMIVDEVLSPSDVVAETARILQLDLDPYGFAQTENVHRLPVLTNRKAVFAAGPARAVQAPENQAMDAVNAARAAAAQVVRDTVHDNNFAEIDPGHCVRCLTCYRVCPFCAISINARVQVMADACEGCGLCVAECPKGAVSLKSPDISTPGQQLSMIPDAHERHHADAPAIFAFCCSRSADQAGRLALSMGLELPAGLQIIEVPCAGRISAGDMLSAFKNNAAGVMVLSCHGGNCHAESGNVHAIRRVGHVADLLEQVGLERDRIVNFTLASNMGFEFYEMVTGFAAQLRKLGQ